MALSRLRWGLGAGLAFLSIVAALRALGAYIDHRLWLGSASVLLLAVIAVAGMVSLGKARLRIERELEGLLATPPAGGWIAARRARLEAVRAAGATLDIDAIATATAAEERGQAYLGRYFVAVTVLVGLVGTFAGLMETLRAVAPLLRDDRLSTAQALALPLAGLDVTFGASVVGILVTLALALVQGDLVLAEEQALARLEEATAHVLVPAIWPVATRPEERVAAEVAALRVEVREALAAAGQATAERVAAQTRAEIERLVTVTREALERVAASSGEALRAAASTSEAATAAMQRSVTETAAAMRATGEAAQKSIAGAAETTQRSLASAAETTQRSLASAAQSVQQSVAAAAETAQQSVTAATDAAQKSVAAATDTAQKSAAATTDAARQSIAAAADAVQQAIAAANERAQTANDALAARAAALVTEAHARATEAATTSATAADAQLRAAGSALADAAGGLRASSAELGGSLATLAPELAALAREVALLAARDDGGAGHDQVVGEELVRLGDGLERLEALIAGERKPEERA